MTTPTKHTQGTHDLEPVSASINFVEMEESVLAYWKEIDAFQTSLKKSEGRKPFSFYDGPPFATGLPHYGHILAGTIKDIVTRYAHQTNHHVIRRAGMGYIIYFFHLTMMFQLFDSASSSSLL